MRVRINALVWDDVNEAHITEHGVTVSEVNQVIRNPHIVVRNRRDRRASTLLVGRTHGGRALCIPIEHTQDTGLWRPVTAYAASAAQTELLRKHCQERP